ncbi:DUF1768-domain-containing protein, partial [Dothidotthia symphoricarpi CBS 119687]
MPVSTIPHPSSSNASSQPQPVYFWRPQDANGYLGQWYRGAFTHEGDTYATAEMWMMVQKARLFGDEAIAKKMLATTNPREHKALGRSVRGFSEGVWDEHKLRIVTEGNYYKFTKSRDAQRLQGLLLATGERELVEASPLDRVWGVGFGERDAGVNRERWGQNLLGRALEEVRERMRRE